jgi:hypothetical protein
MSITRKLAHKAERSEAASRRPPDDSPAPGLRAEGRSGRFKGNTKQAGANVNDAVRH